MRYATRYEIDAALVLPALSDAEHQIVCMPAVLVSTGSQLELATPEVASLAFAEAVRPVWLSAMVVALREGLTVGFVASILNDVETKWTSVLPSVSMLAA